MQVPFLDLKAQHAALEAELTEAFQTIVRGAVFVGGPEVEAFEREFAAFCQADGAVGVGSGTDALRFAYLAMGIKPADEVITVPNSFIATTEALTQAGASVEAGAVTSCDAGRLEFVRKLREHGQAQKYYHDIEGYNGRLDALQAAFLRIKLRRLEHWNQARRSIAALYRGRLSEASDVRLVAETPGSRSVYHLFVVRVPERDRVRKFLQSRGIATGLHYPLPLHQQVAYRHLGLAAGAFPVTEQAAGEILSLPMYPEMRADQVDYVSETLIECFAGRSSRSAPRVMKQLTPA